jgi:hypothetical protein
VHPPRARSAQFRTFRESTEASASRPAATLEEWRLVTGRLGGSTTGTPNGSVTLCSGIVLRVPGPGRLEWRYSVGFLKKSDEERGAAEQAREAKRAERERQAFLASPIGQARTAYEEGDRVFQANFEVMSQTAEIVAMMGSFNTSKANNPTAVLNGIVKEGWELINGSFAFVTEGEQSRDKFMSSGQNVAIKGKMMGYYLFRRWEGNRVST